MAKFAKIIREKSENFLIKKFMSLLERKIANKRKGRFSFVLTGGKSPIRLYRSLSKNRKIPWKKIDFFIGDERYVKESSKHSNIKMCKKNLLNNINISNNQIYKISTNKNSIKKDTYYYNSKIKKYFLNKKVAFDLILLGIGNDGHIASLFKENVNQISYKNVATVKKKDFSRITLTLKCINSCKMIALWAPGKRKSIIIKKILKDKKFRYPASYLKKVNNFLFHSN
tara:strand:- start:961 stop:1641 length:681 start_codon:yes stop_codon:yes gene_type:complete